MGHHGRIPRLVLDCETYSPVDLAKAGPHAYAEDTSTGVHCLAWLLVADGVIQDKGLWLPGQPVPPSLALHIAAGRPVVAHNWQFEWHIWELILRPRYGWPQTSLAQWSCTMARALYHGLPASLAELGPALSLTVQKDPQARENMLRLSRPRQVNPDGSCAWWHEDPREGPPRLARLYAYCTLDAAVEAEADAALPELPPSEQAIFKMDHAINQAGVRIDRDLIDRLQAITREETQRLNGAMVLATAGQVSSLSQVTALGAWLATQGVEAPTLDKEGLALVLAGLPAGAAREALEIRQEGAKASTAKLRSMRAATSRDGRARGMWQYYGAGRTGRWSGRRAQFQNMPRPTLKAALVDLAIRWVLNGRNAWDLALLFPGTVLDIIASCLRGCLAACPKTQLVSIDLAQIEARVIAWLAGQADLLRVFESGEDVYVYTADKVGSRDRQLGKVLVLACGFGMGWRRFQATAAQYGVVLTDTQAQGYVTFWRDGNPKIVRFWYGLQAAFMSMARARHGASVVFGMLTLKRTGAAVRIVLPSGRELVYQQVRITQDEEGRDQIVYWGMHQLTRRWSELRTYGGKLAENVTQAVARDVMAHALLQMHQAGDTIIGSIHDEGLFEAPADKAAEVLARGLAVFRSPPPWGAGLPVWAEGWMGPRYRKG